MRERIHFQRYSDMERRIWQNPEEILTNIGLKSDMTFIDVGCGNGFFAIPAAKIVGAKGRVICIDIDEDSIQSLMRSAVTEGLKNVKTIVGRAEEIVTCEGCTDIVFFGIVLHYFQDPYKVLTNARKMLKHDGILVNLDWRKEDTCMGPPVSIRFDEQRASEIISSQGFRILTVTRSGKYHYLIIAKKQT
ncbi:MAG: class I SAM-dependent methyltransferase [Thermoproteota archaeon]